MNVSDQFIPVPETPRKTHPVLEAELLRKLFSLRQLNLFAPARAVHAVEDTSLALYPGRALALVGESGSGKTHSGEALF